MLFHEIPEYTYMYIKLNFDKNYYTFSLPFTFKNGCYLYTQYILLILKDLSLTYLFIYLSIYLLMQGILIHWSIQVYTPYATI